MSNSIFIKPPILLLSREIDGVSIPIAPNASMTTAEGNPWFSISSVSVDKADKLDDGMYQVTIDIKPHSEDLPRFPKLVIGDHAIGGGASLYFNWYDDSFESGTFVFYIRANNTDEVDAMLNNAYLTIDHALFRVVADGSASSSSIKEIDVKFG